MASTTVYTNLTGQIGVKPRPVLISTTATISQASAPGFLNSEQGAVNNLGPDDAVSLLASDGMSYGGLSVDTDGIITYVPSSAQSASVGTVVYSPEVKVSAADLASGGQKVILTASSPTAQYRIITASTNANESTNFTGPGDRDIIFTDGTSQYGTLLDASLDEVEVVAFVYGYADSIGSQCIALDGLPNALTAVTQPGADIYAIYSGGSTDYDDGQVAITLVVSQVAL